MIYPKEYLEHLVNEKADLNAWKIYPFKSKISKSLGEKTPLQMISYNQQTFFDLTSDALKERMLASRQEIVSNCFKSEWIDDFFVNRRKIDQCIHNSNVKHMGKFNEVKHLYFYNIMDKMNSGFKNTRETDPQSIINITDDIIAESFKIKYFFKEQMDKNLIY